jgi:AcrR family transcriptional regulator
MKLLNRYTILLDMATTLSESARRKPKGDKRDRTRAALLEAARALIREKGYERTTLDEVAQRAGMTTGAIYGNFKNRDELFIALGQTYWAPVKPRLKPGATFADGMRALAEATLEAIPERTTAAVGRLTGLAYTLTNADLRARVHEATAGSYEMGAEWLRQLGDEREGPNASRASCPGDSCPDRGTRSSTDSDPGTLPRRSVLRRVRGVGQSPPGRQPGRPVSAGG